MGASQSSDDTANSSNSSSGSSSGPKKSLYQSYQEKKRGKGPSDEDILKYTGKTRDELNAWAETQPGVGKNQLAGKLAVGPASGFAGAGAGGGLGGWGPDAEPNDGKRGMKFPPTPAPAPDKQPDDA